MRISRDGRKLHAALGELVEFVAVVGDAAAGAAERERGPDDDGEPADLFRHGAGFVQVVRGAADGHVEADGKHQVLEHLPVFALVDGLGVGADHFDAVFLQHAAAVQSHGGVERGLAAERREQTRVCPCALSFFISSISRTMIFSTHFGRDRLDVGAVGELRVGHDGGRIGVHEHDAVALLLERLAGLRAGIIELARLADDDRAGADDEDGMNVSALGHLLNF